MSTWNTRNTHNAPKKQWAKWSIAERALFNELWSNLMGARLGGLASPALDAMPRKDRFVLRHNICFLAADALRVLLKGTK